MSASEYDPSVFGYFGDKDAYSIRGQELKPIALSERTHGRGQKKGIGDHRGYKNKLSLRLTRDARLHIRKVVFIAQHIVVCGTTSSQ